MQVMHFNEVLLLQTFVFVLVSGNCKIVLNEINADIAETENKEFIELSALDCNGKRPSIREYIVIVVREYDKSEELPVIVFSADLIHQVFPANLDFFIIGAQHEFVKPDLSFTNNAVMYTSKFDEINSRKRRKAHSLHDALPNGNTYSMAVILLKDNSRASGEMNKIKLTYLHPITRRPNNLRTLSVTMEIGNIIKNHLADIIIYSRRAPYNRCTFFKTLLNTGLEKPVLKIGTEFDVKGHEDVTINRCGLSNEEQNQMLMLTGFKLGRPTPHLINDCSGPHYILEEHVPEILQQQFNPIPNVLTKSHSLPTACANTKNIDSLIALQEDMVVTDRDNEIFMARSQSNAPTCSKPVAEEELMEQTFSMHRSENFLNRLGKVHAIDKEVACKKLKLNINVNMKVRPWEDRSHFKDEWLQNIRTYQSSVIASTLISSEKQSWLEYILNVASPSESKFRCRFCFNYAKNNKQTNLPSLAHADGFYVNNYKTMWKKLTFHHQSYLHRKSVAALKDSYLKSLQDCSDHLLSNTFKVVSAPTVNMIRSVYAEIKFNIPLESHRDIVDLQNMNGANMGVHHAERRSATRIAESISNKFHSNLITYLKGERRPLSILVDTSTDAGNRNFLFVYLRTIENNWPHTFFYRSLHVKKESPADLLNLIVEALNEDQLYDTVFSNLIGFVSDGSPIMLGRHSGLSKLLNDKSKHKLFIVHCFAHKLQLAVRRAFKHIKGFEDIFEKFINSIYSFYNDKSFKRKESLKSTAELLGEQYWELNYIFPIRWVASELSALKRISNNYRSLVENMKYIIGSKDFSEDITLKANSYLKTLQNVNFYTTLMFVMDVLQIFEGISKQFQESTATLIGKEQIRLKMIQQLQHLKTNDGQYMEYFVKHSKCLVNLVWIQCTTLHLDIHDVQFVKQATTLTLTHSQQSRSHTEWMKLSDLRIKLLNGLLEQVSFYFPEGSLSMFDILLPSNLPKETNLVQHFCTELQPLAMRFELEYENIKDQCIQILSANLNSNFNEYCAILIDNNPITFWSQLLSNEYAIGGSEFIKLIHTILALPIGTADVERGFSILNHIRYDRRSRLTVKHLEELSRIRINGPPLSKFHAEAYASHWINKGHLESDDPIQIRKSKSDKPYRGSSLFDA